MDLNEVVYILIFKEMWEYSLQKMVENTQRKAIFFIKKADQENIFPVWTLVMIYWLWQSYSVI